MKRLLFLLLILPSLGCAQERILNRLVKIPPTLFSRHHFSMRFPMLYEQTRPANNLRQFSRTDFSSGQTYWLGYTTLQSYQNTNVGRMYYWDVQGNLVESQLYYNVKKNNKSVIRLVFQRRNTVVY